MCLAAFAVGVCEPWSLIVAANRDESHHRPAAAADWWVDPAGILGGRDLAAGGSWLAVDRQGRLAAVTNLPTGRERTFPGSRGHLVSDYLVSARSPEAFCNSLVSARERYGPYNLLTFNGERLCYATNGVAVRRLPAGIHVLSNAPMGTPWPKVEFAASRFASILRDQPTPGDLTRRLFEMLEYREPLAAGEAGEDLHWRTRAVFALDERYGTRSSAVVLISRTGEVQLFERRFRPDGGCAGEAAFSFAMVPAGALQATC